MSDAMEAVAIHNLLVSTTKPGLSDQIGLLKQNWVCLQNWLYEEEDLTYFEVEQQVAV